MDSRALQKAVRYLDSWLRFRYERDELPGFVVAVSHNGRLVFNKAYGYANLEKKEKLTPDHIFRIASHSKTFTATAIMQLAEKGKLRITERVVKYVPWLREHKDRRWQNVTLRQLLTHSAGVIRDGLNSDYWGVEEPFPDKNKFKQELLKADLVYDANVKMKYSNYGYTLLGLVIEAASGMPYNEYVIKHIVKPLGLKRTGPEYIPAIESELATGYTRRDINNSRLPIQLDIDTRALSSATGFYSTTEDLCKYASAHFWDSGSLLGRDSKRKMQHTQWRVPNSKRHDKYGLGFEINFMDHQRFVGHGGGFPGYSTQTLFDQGDKLIVVVLTNAIDGGARFTSAGVIQVLRWFQKHYVAKPKRRLKTFEGRFVNLWETADIISVGNKIVSAYPGHTPLDDTEELEYVDDKTLRIKQANGFYSEGELIHYHLTNGRVTKIVKAGGTMLPEKVWFERQKKVKMVGIRSKK